MEQLSLEIEKLNRLVGGFVWGPVMISFLLLAGLYFTVGTGFFQFRRFRLWFRNTFFAIFRSPEVRDKRDPGAISQFQALSTALAGTIGTGNIVGVATAITAGGPGAIFWMWASALVGMMTKYAENVLGNRYRYHDSAGKWVGGPMVYIERGLGCRWLAVLFAVFCAAASFGIGNMTQANSISGALASSFGLSPLAVGIAVATLAGVVILGGIKRLASVTERLVPFMAITYTVGGILIICLNWRGIPGAFAAILSDAFSLRAAGSGAIGFLLSDAVRYGVARGVFTNEAGLGSSVIVNSASNVKEPVRQGMWGIFEVFFDTIVMCTITALAILTSGAHLTGGDGAELAIAAFSSGFGRFGGVFITLAVCCFAFATILGWSYYGERAVDYLFGPRARTGYRLLFIGMTVVGCVGSLRLVWSVSDTFNGLMALPNLTAVLLLSPEVFAETRGYLGRLKKGGTPHEIRRHPARRG